jgi:hypothetical protein
VLEQSCAESRRQQLGIVLGKVPPKLELGVIDCAAMSLTQQATQPVRDIDVTTESREGLGVEGRRIHCVSDLAVDQEIDQQLHRLDGDLSLRLLGAGP